MKQRVMRSLIGRTVILSLALGIAQSSFAQAPPTPAAPPAATPGAAASPDMASSVMEPVRQAIGDQDYEAASRALEAIRQQDPNNPHIAVYESIIKARQAQPSAVGLRTPRAGVTPGPTPEVTPTPTPAPAPASAPSTAATEPADEGIAGQTEKLLENQNVVYGLIGLAVLVVLGIIFMIMKKRKAAREMDEPIAASSMGGSGGLGGMEDYSGAGGDSGYDSFGTSPAGGGLGGSPLSGDFNSAPSTSAYGSSMETPGGGAGEGMGGGAGLAGAGGLAGYTVPSFGDDEEESTPPPKKNLRLAPKPEEDDRPVSLTDDEPEAPAPSAAPEQPSPLAGASSGEALGINFDALSEAEESQGATPPPAAFARPDDETVMVSPPESTSPSSTPTGGPSLDTGAVDLSDIFGEQEPPQQQNVPFSEQPTLVDPTQTGDDEKISASGGDVPFNDQPTLIDDDDKNSETLPTFVSAPGAENPEEEVQVPPKPQRAPQSADDTTISFEELFGSQGMPSSEPEPEPAPKAEAKPEPAPAKPASDISIEDALAATLGAMQAESPDEAPAPAASAVPESTESLDERSERMFREQMEKARKAYDEKNWRQAVHFLSIASALHPENEEAKQMLKEARTEKRKAEESV